MVGRFCLALDELERDDDIKVIVIAGAGTDLSTGLDVAEAERMYNLFSRPGHRIPSQRARLAAHHELWWGPEGMYNRLLHCRKITVLAARGQCLGVGLYLCLYSDLVIASGDASFANPRWRHVGVDGDISMLVAAVGLKRAKELMFCAATWSAEEGRSCGLVDDVVADDALADAVAGLARSCAMIMRDGIATEKQVVFAALAKMQVDTGFAAASVLGGWASNIHHRKGEFNLLRELRDHGPAEAKERSNRHFK
jgi:enoyl-CoA hydratase/carnithine racemase